VPIRNITSVLKDQGADLTDATQLRFAPQQDSHTISFGSLLLAFRFLTCTRVLDQFAIYHLPKPRASFTFWTCLHARIRTLCRCACEYTACINSGKDASLVTPRGCRFHRIFSQALLSLTDFELGRPSCLLPSHLSVTGELDSY
jgi:hypothetical protein